MADIVERIEVALNDPCPSHAIRTLVEALKKEGLSQREMYNLFDAQRHKRHHEADETKYDAILDVMDVIVGWCSPQARLFDKDLRVD